MRLRQTAIILPTLLAFALAGCAPSPPENVSEQPSEPTSPAPSSVTEAPHYHAELALSGKPVASADGKEIVVTVSVTNDGPSTFSSSTGLHNVNLGAHAIDKSGKVVVNDLSRAAMPLIASGATHEVSILLPVGETLGNRVELMPVEENVGWFDQWGTKPLVVGPFEACSGTAAGKVCDESGEPLSVVSAQ